MTTPITYTDCRLAPTEMTAILNHEVVGTAANDSDAYPSTPRATADVIPIPRPH